MLSLENDTPTQINNTERLREWLRTCPSIALAKYFGADYIGENATEYAVIATPSMLRYRENIVGDRILLDRQEQNFIFAAKVPYGRDVDQNLENHQFLQNIANWIYAQNSIKNFPEWDRGYVTSIDCVNTGAPVQTGSDAARYQFQIRVNYRIRERND